MVETKCLISMLDVAIQTLTVPSSVVRGHHYSKQNPAVAVEAPFSNLQIKIEGPALPAEMVFRRLKRLAALIKCCSFPEFRVLLPILRAMFRRPAILEARALQCSCLQWTGICFFFNCDAENLTRPGFQRVIYHELIVKYFIDYYLNFPVTISEGIIN